MSKTFQVDRSWNIG